MEARGFSVREALAYGWEKTVKNLGFFVKLLLFIFLITYLPNIIIKILQTLQERGTIQLLAIVLGLFLLISILINLLSHVIAMGLLKISLKIYDNQTVKISDVFSCWRLFFKYVFGLVLYMLIVVVGLVLLIIPGIILAVRCGFFGYFIVDKGLGPIASLKRSYEITKGYFWRLLSLNILIALIVLVGMLLLFVGVIIAFPVTMLASVWVYRRLTAEPIEGAQPA